MWQDKNDIKDIRKCLDDYSVDELKFLSNFFDDECYIIQMTKNCMTLSTNYDYLDEQLNFCLDYRDFINDKIKNKEKEND